MKRTAKGMKLPGLYMRGDVWWFTYRLGGKKHFHSLGTADYGEAVQKALEIRKTPTLEPAAVFLAEIDAFVAHKLARNEYSPASAYHKKYSLRAFAKVETRANPASVTTADVEKFYRGLQKRVTESTAQAYLTSLRSFFNWLVKARKVRANPVEGVELDRLDEKGRQKFCNAELRDRLITTAPNDTLRFVLFCGFHAGMRKREIVEARPEWFDLERNSVTIRATSTFRPKDREERTVPLTAAFRAFLATYGLPGPFMAHPEIKHGVSIYRWDLRRVFTTHVGAQGCPWVTPHVMRHTFASLLASAGVSIFKIAKWLGDDVRIVQKHYAKLLPGDTDIEKAF